MNIDYCELRSPCHLIAILRIKSTEKGIYSNQSLLTLMTDLILVTRSEHRKDRVDEIHKGEFVNVI